MKKLLLVDGNSILNRAYYGIRPLTAPDGTPTNAVYGFLNILWKYMEEENPDYLCVAFDVKEKTFRHKMYDQYKAQRKPAPEDFLVQLPLMKEVLGAMNCACIEKPGYEADDLIGTVAQACEKEGVACRILTGDKDDLQLASENTIIKLIITRMGRTDTTDYDAAAVLEKYGVTPAEFIDVKGLMGDPSDNIPGVKGIGEKTAFSLIQQYKSIDHIYANADEIEVTDSVRKKLKEGENSARLSKTLATIDRNVPISVDFRDFALQEYDIPKTAELFRRLNFRSFLQRPEFSGKSTAPTGGTISAKTETVSWTELSQKIPEGKMLCYRLTDTALYVTWDGDTVYCAESPKAEDLQAFFENEAWQKCGYELQEDILRLAEKGISMRGMGFDISLAAYLAEPTQSSYDLETLCITYLGKELSAEETQTDEDGQIAMNFGSAENRQADADAVAAIFALWQYFAEKLKRDGQSKLYYEVELPLAEVLADMQMTGMYVDKEALSEFGEMLKLRIHETEEEIYRLAGEEFNINSPKQLGEILFGKLKLPGGKKNKNGYSTNVDELNRLAESHPIAEKILLFRRYSKLDSTYVEGLLPLIRKSTGRLHSKFRQTVTATGRISSTEPNLQNIPVRTELGRELRKMFAAEGEDACFVDADYSQIELRVLADITGDEAMCDAFRNGEDIHAKTAARVAGVPLDRVTPKMRSDAKAVNFGIVYGIGAFSLAQDLHISRKEADEYIKSYLMQYPKVAAYRTETVEKAKEQGYVTTKFGRRRNMPELKSSNHITRAFGERVALNAPIQGTAADIIKIAMVRVHQRLKQEVPSAKLVLQVHDELIIECPVAESERVKGILRDEMEHACELSVPLVVDMNVGKSWYDTK